MKDYESERNFFIPLAERIANEAVPFTDTDDGKAKWNRVFHTTMNRLWKEKTEKHDSR